MNDAWVAIKGAVIKESGPAVKFRLENGEEIWIPRSEISDISNMKAKVKGWVVKKNPVLFNTVLSAAA